MTHEEIRNEIIKRIPNVAAYISDSDLKLSYSGRLVTVRVIAAGKITPTKCYVKMIDSGWERIPFEMGQAIDKIIKLLGA